MQPRITPPHPEWAEGRAALTVEEAAPILGLTAKALSRQVDRQQVPSVRIGGLRRIPVAYLLAIYSGEQHNNPAA